MREREAEEMRLTEGAFPALLSAGVGGSAVTTRGGGGGGGFGGGGRGAKGGGHRVLLVDSRTKRVKVESYSRSSGMESEEEDVVEASMDDERVPPPAREVEYSRVRRGPATRWVDLKGDGTAKYVALSAVA